VSGVSAWNTGFLTRVILHARTKRHCTVPKLLSTIRVITALQENCFVSHSRNLPFLVPQAELTADCAVYGFVGVFGAVRRKMLWRVFSQRSIGGRETMNKLSRFWTRWSQKVLAIGNSGPVSRSSLVSQMDAILCKAFLFNRNGLFA